MLVFSGSVIKNITGIEKKCFDGSLFLAYCEKLIPLQFFFNNGQQLGHIMDDGIWDRALV